MRLIKLLSLCVLMTLVSARPASAWFEWLDYLSGPGRFWGVRVDVRYWCSGQKSPTGDVKEKLETAVRNTERILIAPGPAPRTLPLQDWMTLAETIELLNTNLRVLDSKATDLLKDAKTGFTSLLPMVKPAAAGGFEPVEAQVSADAFNTFRVAAEQVRTVAQQFIAAELPVDIAISATGIFISLCSPDIERRWALEDGSSIMFAFGAETPPGDKAPKYAAGDPIWLITHTEALTYRVTTNRNWDFIDLGFQAGLYAFASGGFETFGGFIIEPFADLRFPSGWARTRNEPWWSRFNVRVGAANFPAGIDLKKFAATPELLARETRVSPSEFVPTITLYYRIYRFKKQKVS